MNHASIEGNPHRRPEDTAQMWHRARAIHQRLRPSVAPEGSELRLELANDPCFAALKPALARASIALRDAAARAALLRLVKGTGFATLQFAARKRMLSAIAAEARATVTAEVLADLERAVACLRFADASAAVQELLARELLRPGRDRLVRRGLCAIFALAGFGALAELEQLELLRWFAGPITAAEIAPMRRNRMELWWNTRRVELLALIERADFRMLDAPRQAESIRDFLHRPARPVCFADATELSGHAVIVFGDPADPRSLSYGRRWVRSGAKRPFAKISSPDPTVASGWKKPESDAITTYATQTLMVSRRNEHAFVAWIEKSYALADDLRVRSPLGPAAVSGDPATFMQQALAALARLACESEPARGYLRGGRSVTTLDAGEDDRAHQQLLAAYLCA